MLQHTAVVVTCSEPAEPCASQRLDFAFSQSHQVVFFLNLIYKAKPKYYFLLPRLRSLQGLQSLDQTWRAAPGLVVP